TAGERREVQPSHVAHVGMLVRELPHTGGESLAQSFRVARAVVVSFASPRRRGVGCDWRGHRLLRNGAGLREIARTIWPADRRLPTGAGKIGVDGAGNNKGAITGVASHPHDGSGHGPSPADFFGQ